MTTLELIHKQMENAGFQLEKAFEGIDDSSADHKAHASAMSPREMVIHLGDCYVATQKHARGEEHEWGTWAAPDPSFASAWNAMKTERGKAIEAVMAADEEKAAETATDFLILHDAYHVGQMCTNRLSANPEWNAYSIYPG